MGQYHLGEQNFKTTKKNAMGKLRVGNKKNSFLNGEWAGHVRAWGKKFTARLRRAEDKKIIRQEVKNLYDFVN